MLRHGILSLANAWLLTTAVAAQSYKLNAPLAPGGDVGGFELTPDGQWIVYLGDQEKNDIFRLYVVPADGSASPRPLGRFVPFGDVQEFAISATGERVVYRADHDTDEVFELYSVPVDGRERPRKLSGPMVSGGSVEPFSVDFPAFQLGGERVVYRADQDQDGVFELYGAPLDGSAPARKWSAPLAPGREIHLFHIARDGNRVVYTADLDAELDFELFSATLDGAASIELNAPLAPGGAVRGFEISPDSSRIVYLASRTANEIGGILFGVPIDGSTTPVLLSGPMVAGGSVPDGLFRITPDGARVVYLADQDVNDVFELFSARLDGSQTAIQLNRPLFTGGDAVLVGFENQGFQISPDGQRVVYQADGASVPVELYSAQVAVAQSSVRISAPIQPGAGTRMLQFQISPDSQHVVYRAERPTRDRLELYSTSIANDLGVVKLNELLPSQGQTYFFAISPDSRSVVYTADQDASFVREIFGVPIDHGRPVRKLNAPLVAGGGVFVFPSGFRISPDSRRAFYLADQDTRGMFELYGSFLSVERQIVPPHFTRR